MNVLSIFDVADDIADILNRAAELKKGKEPKELTRKTLGLLFEKTSTRTRVSFEVAMTHLGGHTIYLNPQDTQMVRGEPTRDTARTLSRYLDAVAIRKTDHTSVEEFSSYSTIPVINALTDREHPCQALADLFTIKEKKRSFNVKTAYIGDGNNVCNSLVGGAALVGMEIAVATPEGYEPEREIIQKAKKIPGSKITLTNDPKEAVRGAEIIYTDVWVSMGQEKDEADKLKAFKGFQVDKELLKRSNNALLMHCLPAKLGREVSKDAFESPSCIAFDQAENRLHVQKALLEKVI